MRTLGWLSSTALILSFTAIGVVLAPEVAGTFGSPAYASTSCDSSGSPALVHYLTTASGDGPDFYDISGVDISGLPSTCDGLPVLLQLWGDSGGDSSIGPGDDSLLSTADSSLNACSQAPLTSPLVVEHGDISLPLCSGGGPAAYVIVEEVTMVSLFVAGNSTPVVSGGDGSVPIQSGGSTIVPAGGSGAPSVPNSDWTAPTTTKVNGKGSSPSLLAFTGSSIAIDFLIGVLLLVTGLGLTSLTRRRRAVNS